MEITRKSDISGKENTLEIDVTQDQIDLWNSGVPIQKAMPNVSEDEREFIKTGITAEEWEDIFKV